MARPHPVVGIPAELADRRGGRAPQADIRVDLHDEREELVAAEEGFDLDLHAGVLLLQALPQRGDVLPGDAGILLLTGRRGDVAHDAGCHVGNPAHEAHLAPRSGQLLGIRHCPEAILQVVVLDRREALNRGVAAVVVGKEQTLGRDDLARAAAAEDDDGILERGVVHAVDLLGRKFAAALLHLLDVHALQVGQHPHALVRRGRQGHARRSQK